MSGIVSAVPDVVLDHLGQEVRVGDRIAYACLLGRSATISVSEVLGFQWSPGWGTPRLKIKVQGTELHHYGGEETRLQQKAPGLIYADYRRFVRL